MDLKEAAILLIKQRAGEVTAAELVDSLAGDADTPLANKLVALQQLHDTQGQDAANMDGGDVLQFLINSKLSALTFGISSVISDEIGKYSDYVTAHKSVIFNRREEPGYSYRTVEYNGRDIRFYIDVMDSVMNGTDPVIYIAGDRLSGITGRKLKDLREQFVAEALEEAYEHFSVASNLDSACVKSKLDHKTHLERYQAFLDGKDGEPAMDNQACGQDQKKGQQIGYTTLTN